MYELPLTQPDGPSTSPHIGPEIIWGGIGPEIIWDGIGPEIIWEG